MRNEEEVVTETVVPRPVEVAQPREELGAAHDVVFGVRDLAVHYGKSPAFKGVTLELYRNMVSAIIGPSGCGKSTFIRCLNRMNDLVAGARVGGSVMYHGQDLYGSGVDPVAVRRRTATGSTFPA